MIHWHDLSIEEQATFGDGCGSLARGLNVPDFIFEASCRQHDFYYYRGGWPWHKVIADWWFFYYMVKDAMRYSFFTSTVYIFVALVYSLTVLLVSWPFFSFGRWRSKEEILLTNAYYKDLARVRGNI